MINNSAARRCSFRETRRARSCEKRGAGNWQVNKPGSMLWYYNEVKPDPKSNYT